MRQLQKTPVVPPLIKVKLLLEDTVETFGIYDSGANVSLINSKLLKLQNKKMDNARGANLSTINGVKKTKGMITIKIKIFNIEKVTDVFVIENFQ